MSKQTAVQWLQTLYNNIDEPLTDKDFEQALAIEREQIEEAFNQGFILRSLDGSIYFNQTFKPQD